MIKTQVYFPADDLGQLHKLAADTGRSVAELVREAVRRVWLRPKRRGPIAIWKGPCARPSTDHDAIYDDGV
jgi:hypothetical protein